MALIPPVSGGACRLSAEPLDPAAVIAEVADERAGGIAVFVGTTRVHSRGRTVLHLDYEAYEGMAEQVMEELAADLQRKYDLCAVAIAHRVGRVGIGESSVVIAVSAPHRGDALAACKDASTGSRRPCRCGRRRSTRAARSGSGGVRNAEGQPAVAREAGFTPAQRRGPAVL